MEILTTSSDPAATDRRSQSVSEHSKLIGMDFINVGYNEQTELLFLYFIPSKYEGKSAVPQIQAKNIYITDTAGAKEASDIKITKIADGKWEFDIKTPIDTGINFDGSARATSNNLAALAEQSFTIEFWAKRDAPEENRFEVIIGMGQIRADRCLYIGFKETGQFTFGFYKDDLDTGQTWTDNSWHHWACVYDAPFKKQAIYCDGVKIASRRVSDNYAGTGDFSIGDSSWDSYHFARRASSIDFNTRVWNRNRTAAICDNTQNDYHFKGSIADVRVWNYARTSKDIAKNIYSRVSETENQLIAYWTFAETEGIIAKDITDNSADAMICGNFNREEFTVPLPDGYEMREEDGILRVYETVDCLTITLSRNLERYRPEVSDYTIELSKVNYLDPFFSKLTFSFDTQTEFDPGAAPYVKTELESGPEIDYLTKDYKSFRRLMIDRVSALASNWTDPHTFDPIRVMIEAVAYKADYLSYFQDAVAMEAYLGTSLHRISVTRHARFLDYFMHEGCNARVFVHIQVNEKETSIGKGVRLITKQGDQPVCISEEIFTEKLLPDDPVVFETMHSDKLFKEHNEIFFYTWGGSNPYLTKGSTSTTLDGELLNLKPGHVLIFEEVKGKDTGFEKDANPKHRHAVRVTKITRTKDLIEDKPVTIIEWPETDALPFDLPILTEYETNISVARGNIVLADHGRTIENEELSIVPETEIYVPRLYYDDVTYGEPYTHTLAAQIGCEDILEQNPHSSYPAVKLVDKNYNHQWTARRDLLYTDRFTQAFVVEVENDRRTYLRFGDDKMGRRPIPGTQFNAQYRVGNGTEGNIGRDMICHIITDQQDIKLIRNPLSARGGTVPEDMEKVKLYAPYAFQTQERCVTLSDYVEKLESHPQVRRAAATIRWTGAWTTVFVSVYRAGSEPADDEFLKSMKAYLEKFRLAGADIQVGAPRFVGLEIALTITVAHNYFRNTVEKELFEVFSDSELEDSKLGFFHPDNFTFGQSVYLSPLLTKAKEITGVADVIPTIFRRYGNDSFTELNNGKIEIEELEIARLDNNLKISENGTIRFTLLGGM